MIQDSRKISSDFDLKSVRNMVIIWTAAAFVVLGTMFFLPALTFTYWHAWIYLLALGGPMVFIAIYLYKRDPELLKRRMMMKEDQMTQKIVIALACLVFIPAFVLPGFDYRFGWSNIPLAIVIVADVMVLGGYLIVGLVFKVNSYASRIIKVEKGQTVIITGPYKIVRHPMYLGVLLFCVFSPIALGSYWALIPASLMAPVLVVRIIGEERELKQHLEGYKEYAMKTRYRLVPGVW